MARNNRGTDLRVTTNSFEITRLPTRVFYQYEEISPDVKNARRAQEIVERLQTHTAPDVFTPRCVYDGKAILYAPHKLNLAGGASGNFNVSMTDRPPQSFSGDRPPSGVFSVKLISVAAADVEFSALNAFITGALRQQTPQVLVATNLLQFLVRQAPNLKYPNNARSYFTPANLKTIGGGLELWRGYFQSVRPTQGKMLVNVDVSTSAMIRSGPFIEVAMNVLGMPQDNVRRLTLEPTDPAFRKLKSFFKNVFIILGHIKNRRVKKQIRGLVPHAGRAQFERQMPDGHVTKPTVAEYYQQVYNYTVQHPDIIGIEVGNRNRSVIIPAELCIIIEGQIFKRKVPPELTKQVVEFSTQRPEVRLDMIKSGVGQTRSPVLEYHNSDFIKNAQMAISSAPVMIDGRVLPTPDMSYGRENRVKPRNGSWNVMNCRFYAPASLAAWAVVDYSLDKFNAERNTSEFVSALTNSMTGLGMHVKPVGCFKSGVGASSVYNDLMEAGTQAMRSPHVTSLPPKERPNTPQLIIVILPSSAADIRSAVKRFGDIDRGVPTQCIREDKIRRVNNQYCNNVALKINVRLKGDNSVPRCAALSTLQSSPFMVVGADVGHPGAGIRNQPSVASLVWSYDKFAVKYVALSRVQNPRQEAIEDLEEMMREALDKFGAINRRAPDRILFYRDGLSEGEYEVVGKKEIGAIESAVDAIWQARGVQTPKPAITFIVVGKRHHVRFFPDKQQADRSGNCPAGFVADRGIGNPVAQDFYLQSHGGLLGTSRPSHYIVLRDDIFKQNIGDLQELSFALCHAYARATRSVSIPAPVYYADIVCARAAFHFDSRLDYDNSMTVSDEGLFNIDEWKSGYKQLNGEIAKTMYFI